MGVRFGNKPSRTNQLTVPAANLGLRDDQLARVGIVGADQRVLENADGTQNVASNLDLVGEVARVTKNHLGAGLELHLRLDTSHGSLDTNSLASLVDELIDVGVEHIGTAVDGTEAGETLGELSQSVERVDIRRLSVARNTVAIQADALDGLGRSTGFIQVGIVVVKRHGVADKVLGCDLEAELVVDLLHGATAQVES